MEATFALVADAGERDDQRLMTQPESDQSVATEFYRIAVLQLWRPRKGGRWMGWRGMDVGWMP
jgi:hypothetical protein